MICHIFVVVSNVVKIISAIIYIAGPINVNALPPCFPAQLPANGATALEATEYGKISKPVIKALYFTISCKKMAEEFRL